MAGSATLTGVRARLAIVAVALGITGCASAPAATTGLRRRIYRRIRRRSASLPVPGNRSSRHAAQRA